MAPRAQAGDVNEWHSGWYPQQSAEHKCYPTGTWVMYSGDPVLSPDLSGDQHCLTC